MPKLSDDEHDSLEGPLRFDECQKVLETFQNDNSPGEDGFTVEFSFDLLGNNLILHHAGSFLRCNQPIGSSNSTETAS